MAQINQDGAPLGPPTAPLPMPAIRLVSRTNQEAYDSGQWPDMQAMPTPRYR